MNAQNALIRVPKEWLSANDLRLFLGVDRNCIVHVWREPGLGARETACGSAICEGPCLGKPEQTLCRGCFQAIVGEA